MCGAEAQEKQKQKQLRDGRVLACPGCVDGHATCDTTILMLGQNSGSGQCWPLPEARRCCKADTCQGGAGPGGRQMQGPL